MHAICCLLKKCTANGYTPDSFLFPSLHITSLRCQLFRNRVYFKYLQAVPRWTMFFELPSCILSGILSSWLHIKTVARLDSACCGKSIREEYLQLCQRKGILHLQMVKVTSRSLVLWLIERRIHLASVEISVDAHVSLFAKVFSITGEQLRSVKISRQSDSIVVAIKACLHCIVRTLLLCTFSIAPSTFPYFQCLLRVLFWTQSWSTFAMSLMVFRLTRNCVHCDVLQT